MVDWDSSGTFGPDKGVIFRVYVRRYLSLLHTGVRKELVEPKPEEQVCSFHFRIVPVGLFWIYGKSSDQLQLDINSVPEKYSLSLCRFSDSICRANILSVVSELSQKICFEQKRWQRDKICQESPEQSHVREFIGHRRKP
jgi:hypothetical protein